jgi:hypothetical protein
MLKRKNAVSTSPLCCEHRKIISDEPVKDDLARARNSDRSKQRAAGWEKYQSALLAAGVAWRDAEAQTATFSSTLRSRRSNRKQTKRSALGLIADYGPE